MSAHDTDAIYGPAARAILDLLPGFTQAQLLGEERVNDPGLVVHPQGKLDKARELLVSAGLETVRQVKRGLEGLRERMDRDEWLAFGRAVDSRLDFLDPCIVRYTAGAREVTRMITGSAC